jgi:type VI protein secretion system component Hcp
MEDFMNRRVSSGVIAVLLAVTTALASAPAQADITLNIPGVSGDSKTAANQVDVLSLQFGVTDRVTDHLGGKAQFSDVTITKHPDSTSGTFALDAMSGQTIGAITITITKSDGSRPAVVAAQFTLTGVTVTGYTYADSGAVNAPSVRSALDTTTETITLSYSKIEWKLAGVAPPGKTAPLSTGGWNVTANTKM